MPLLFTFIVRLLSNENKYFHLIRLQKQLHSELSLYGARHHCVCFVLHSTRVLSILYFASLRFQRKTRPKNLIEQLLNIAVLPQSHQHTPIHSFSFRYSLPMNCIFFKRFHFRYLPNHMSLMKMAN